MKTTLFALSLIFTSLMLPSSTRCAGNAVKQNERCKAFSVSGVVRRRLVDAPGRVGLFDFRSRKGEGFLSNITFDEPTLAVKFFSVLRPGNKVAVLGRHCGFDYFADSIKRVR